jgi:hypothetical protein
MFPPPIYNQFLNNQESSRIAQQTKAVRTAHLRYQDAKRRSWWRQKFAALIGRPHHLCELSQVREQNSFINYRPAGIRSVTIDSIVGSENRADDFDDRFLPVKNHDAERWIRIAELMLLNVTLPAVDLIKVNEFYYVRDGHHRISVAKYFGQKHIDANVVELVVEPHNFEPQEIDIGEAVALNSPSCSTA